MYVLVVRWNTRATTSWLRYIASARLRALRVFGTLDELLALPSMLFWPSGLLQERPEPDSRDYLRFQELPSSAAVD